MFELKYFGVVILVFVTFWQWYYDGLSKVIHGV